MIYEFLKTYAEKNPIRLHMPGHKGVGEAALPYHLDITEIEGADALYKASGIILKDERRAARLFGAEDTFFSTGGCTLCIQTMVMIAKQEGYKTIYVYNPPHTSFFNACEIIGMTYVITENIPKGAAVFITSPDYFGRIINIHQFKDNFVMVDNAHGAHLAFYSDAYPSNADFWCDSGHKTLPGLTGTAYLHTSRKFFREKVKKYMSMLGSSSPSYLLLASLDLTNDYIENQIAEDIYRTASLLPRTNGDIYHIAIANKNGILNLLQQNGIVPETVTDDFIILLFSPMSRTEDILITLATIQGTEFYTPNHNDQKKIFDKYI